MAAEASGKVAGQTHGDAHSDSEVAGQTHGDARSDSDARVVGQPRSDSEVAGQTHGDAATDGDEAAADGVGTADPTAEDKASTIVAVVEDVTGSALDELSQRYELRAEPDAWCDASRLAQLLRSARALVVRNRTQVTRQLLEEAPELQVVARAGVGLDNVDVQAADDLGIVVVAAVGANAQSVAEHALGMALALARDLVGADRQVRAGHWDRRPGMELAGRSWGVIGLGATGRATAALAAAIGMEVLGYDPFLDRGPVAGLERVDELGALLGRSDVVSLHLAVSDQTRALVGPEFLDAMRPGAFLVNVARGELVDEHALLRALDGGTLSGAALDVRVAEPPHLDGLTVHPRVLSTPHVAGITGAAQGRVVDMIAADVERVLSGHEAVHAVGRHRAPARV